MEQTVTTSAETEIAELGRRAKSAARLLALASTSQKNAALEASADALESNKDRVWEANAADVKSARERGVKESLIDRLALGEVRIAEMAAALREIAGLPDPVGVIRSGSRRPNGLEIREVTVPLGVVGMIYESRPNVTVDAVGL